MLAGLIPTLESRLGAERIVEECEELRLEQLRLLDHTAREYPGMIANYIGEVSCVMMQVLQDPFVAIRMLANELFQFLVEKFPFIIHQYAEGLVIPLTISTNHQQSKVRAVTVTSIGRLLKIAAPELLRKNFSTLVMGLTFPFSVCLEAYL